MTLSRQTLVAAGLLGGALAAWVASVERMRGMGTGPGTELGSLGWFVGVWAAMTAAMMLPAAAPAVLVHAKAVRGSTVLFVAGYLVVWTAYGLAAFGIYRGIRAADPGFLAWDRGGPWIAGGALVCAGIYEVTPLKTACLSRCRSPLELFLPARGSAIGRGLAYGALCVGCCAGLMLALFALGVMSIFWMTVVAVVILAEKVLPVGDRLVGVSGGALVLLGIVMGLAPGSVP